MDNVLRAIMKDRETQARNYEITFQSAGGKNVYPRTVLQGKKKR